MNTDIIKKRITDTLTQLGVAFDAVEVTESPLGGKQTFVIKTPESGILIGESGETLAALSHLLKRMVQQETKEEINFSIDINDYQAHKIDELKTKAHILANRARDMKIAVEMEPMSSYERLIVHDALAGEADISTESTGEGRSRRVVIKFKTN